jgi:hypothetical protein
MSKKYILCIHEFIEYHIEITVKKSNELNELVSEKNILVIISC